MIVDNAVTAYNAIKAAGFSGDSALMALAISGAESTFNPTAVGDAGLQGTDESGANWGPSIGLFQIRSLVNYSNYGYPDNLRIASKLTDPVYNAKAAYAISKKGTDWTPWSTYVNGAYQSYLTVAQEASALYQGAKNNPGLASIILLLIIAAAFILK